MFVEFALLLVTAGFSDAVGWDTWTPLDAYIAKPDPSYNYTLLVTHVEVIEGVTLYVFNMTSQTWFDESFSNHPLWWHVVGVAIPANLKSRDTAYLFVDGGSNRPNASPPPADDDTGILISLFANETGMIGIYIKAIPNQPIVFAEDELKLERSEDTQIAFTWRLFMENSTRTDVLNRLPMTKACIRALDTAAKFAKEKDPETNLQKFLISGASKRGWTTLMVAASDQRVIGIIPMVMSLLNFKKNIINHYQRMDGAWSYALQPYYREGVTRNITDPILDELAAIEDPYHYRERLTMPKLFILGSGDPFFLLDDSHHFWDGLLGTNYIMMLPNTGHSMAPWYLDIGRSSYNFARWLIGQSSFPFPHMVWSRSEDVTGGTITLTATPAPDRVVGMYSETLGNDTRRDFRLASLDETGDPETPGLHPIRFREANVELLDENSWKFERTSVQGEWVAFYIECYWGLEEDEGYSLRLTTEVQVIPNVQPRGPCIGIECEGYLI